MTTDAWRHQLEGLGAFIREQRQMANLSLRQLAEIARVSNPYLSQIERGLHEPSVRVLKAIADALDLSAETLLHEAGLLDQAEADGDARVRQATERALRADPLLTEAEKDALVAVYRSYVAGRSTDRE